ncbi:KpsF/GutQ family sugar-phosphate isomerase [uncultured Helicobacter sp.]|uniref:KpsF/GutQ family sugar-phosphate isomerase n=1 Tax=uncultured Helicobacter sp. TaxID=175537 RepID=UPI002635DDBC|nr:KpsF/GutQ family sugar-phosphate isomerase [uncultured Helicobacter sp.]
MRDFIGIAKEVFDLEAQSILDLKEQINSNFNAVITCILGLKGRLIISGMGKSGHIGAKIAATLASTGTPSFFMHPAEALHGDLGMLREEDALLAISNSGESEEILRLIPSIKARKIPLIGLSGKSDSTLAKQSDYFLSIKVEKEACPLQLAPTSSTTATLAMGDAIAVALMRAKNFKLEDFALFHPGGSLGRKLLTRVKDIMIKENLPIVTPDLNFKSLIAEMTSKKLGMCLVCEDTKLLGIITDGDLRRALNADKFNAKAYEIMTSNPKTIDSNAMATEAESLMLKHNIKELAVMHNTDCIGIVQLYAIAKV